MKLNRKVLIPIKIIKNRKNPFQKGSKEDRLARAIVEGIGATLEGDPLFRAFMDYVYVDGDRVVTGHASIARCVTSRRSERFLEIRINAPQTKKDLKKLEAFNKKPSIRDAPLVEDIAKEGNGKDEQKRHDGITDYSQEEIDKSVEFLNRNQKLIDHCKGLIEKDEFKRWNVFRYLTGRWRILGLKGRPSPSFVGNYLSRIRKAQQVVGEVALPRMSHSHESYHEYVRRTGGF